MELVKVASDNLILDRLQPHYSYNVKAIEDRISSLIEEGPRNQGESSPQRPIINKIEEETKH